MAVYVMSDVHGLKDKYDALMQKITKEDTLYVLGDLIDRGPDGIPILQDIMTRDNVKMILGNHESMMIEYYQAKADETMEPRLRSELIDRWCWNHNISTIRAFEALSETQQASILAYLKQLPLAYSDVEVNNRHFYLVHGTYVKDTLDEKIITREYAINKGLKEYDFTWGRFEKEQAQFDIDRIVVVGHTPTVYFQEEVKPYMVWMNHEDIKQANVIDIDCGCAGRNEDSRLALLCLDDLSIQYF